MNYVLKNNKRNIVLISNDNKYIIKIIYINKILSKEYIKNNNSSNRWLLELYTNNNGTLKRCAYSLNNKLYKNHLFLSKNNILSFIKSNMGILFAKSIKQLNIRIN